MLARVSRESLRHFVFAPDNLRQIAVFDKKIRHFDRFVYIARRDAAQIEDDFLHALFGEFRKAVCECLSLRRFRDCKLLSRRLCPASSLVSTSGIL
jgi:hypothetical protein